MIRLPGTLKYCPKCQADRPVEDFYTAPNRHDGLSAYCKTCLRKEASSPEQKEKHKTYISRYSKQPHIIIRNRERHWRLQGIKTSEGNAFIQKDFDQLFEKQLGMCAICLTSTPTKQGFVVDHDHKTGIIRGILCMPCNTALGLFGESLKKLVGCMNYLTRDRL